LIPGTTTVQLDSPSAQLLVHGFPTSYSLADIGKELTTYNTGLALAQPPRWLRPEEQRVGKKASTVIITTTGPKVQDFALQARLSAFSSTFRLERRLRLRPNTHCCNCQQFGHHTLKCTNQPPAIGVHNHTLLGNIPIPQQPATRVAISAHTLLHCMPTAAAPMKHIQPHAVNV